MHQTTAANNEPLATPAIGTYIVVDGWATNGRIGGTNLEEGVAPSNDGLFPGSEFIARTPSTDVPLAVNVTVTSRKLRWEGHPFHTGPAVRIRIEFVEDDGLPSTFASGWMVA